MSNEVWATGSAMQKDSAWVASSTPQTPGWMQIPGGKSDVDAWVEETSSRMLSSWGVVARVEEVREVVQDLLRGAWEHRDSGALLNLLCWPSADPILARVSIRVTRRIDPDEWVDQGYRVESYRADALGSGIQCTSVRRLNGAAVVSMTFAFFEGDDAVLVTLAPVMTPVFDAIAPGLHLLVDQLEVVRPNGDPYFGESVPGYIQNDFDEWQVESSV